MSSNEQKPPNDPGSYASADGNPYAQEPAGEAANPYAPAPGASAGGNPYAPGAAPGNPYAPGPAPGNPYVPGAAPGNPYAPGAAPGNPYAPGPGGGWGDPPPGQPPNPYAGPGDAWGPYGPPPGGAFGGPGGGGGMQYGPNKPTESMATVSLVTGVLGLLTSFCCGLLGLPLPIVAIVCGFMAISKINQNPQQYGGKGLAIGGLVCGFVAILIVILIFSLGMAARFGRMP